MASTSGQDDTFKSLIDRSIEACASIYFGAPEKKQAKLEANRQQLSKLRNIDSILTGREFWFFQRKDAFFAQTTWQKWTRDHLDDYVLLPMRDEFINRQDCVFVSHAWATPAHPDPNGDDLRELQRELQDTAFAYIWIDWTCLPQYQRTEAEERYGYDCRELTANLIHHCHFRWVRRPYTPRAWILYEVAEAFFLGTVDGPESQELRMYWEHLAEMRAVGVRPVLDKYGYKCAIASDLELIIPRLAVAVILKSLTAKIDLKQECIDQAVLSRGGGQQITVGRDTVYMNIYKGEMEYHGMILRFPPFPKSPLQKSSAKHNIRHQRRLREEIAAITGQEMPPESDKEKKVKRTTGGFREGMRRFFSMSYTT